ncbi:MAG TPA: hypothetical protein VK123_04770 [Candidatus Limnocylindrales bacterium]|nr:hypothetical protein [Candidatus Limnocylindrales bacterium]
MICRAAHLREVTRFLAFAAFALVPARAGAVPDWKSQRTVGSLTVYADDTRPNRFYYAPLEIAVVTTPEGRPDFHFLETRYTGSGVSRDQGISSYKGLVTFRVRLPRIPADELARAARELAGSGGSGAPADLRPFPVKNIPTALVYATIGGSDTTALPAGRFESSDEGTGTAGGSYWAERIYTMGLDPNTAQAFRSALEKDQVYLSLGYAFMGDARAADAGFGELTGSPVLVDALKKTLASVPDSAAADSIRPHVIRAGAIEIGLDVKRFPDLMRRVDLNDRAPPGYAALDVYCYDFNNELRPDLAEKQVEIDAEGITGRRVTLSAWFTSSDKDLYSASIRFPVAVRLDRPYRYRVREVKQDGREHAGAWRESASWSQILDVTTPAKEAGVRSVLGP